MNFLNTIILLGAIQGIITSILLRLVKTNKDANELLSWIIFLISLACLNIYFLEAIELTSTFWNIAVSIIPLVIIMPLGSLVYFYVKSILTPEFQLQKRHKIHFYTIILDLVPYAGSAVLVIASIFGLINPNDADNWSDFTYNYNKYVDIPRWISLTIYIIITYKMIKTYKAKDKNTAFFRWSRNFLLGFSIFTFIWLLHLIPYIIPSLSNHLLGSVGWYPVYIPLIILIYWLGINGYIISFKEFKKASKESLSKKVIDDTYSLLEDAMKKDRLFLNPTLKLNDVVQHINVSQKVISSVLNQHNGKTFNEYINEYRIEAFKEKLLNDNSENLTITGMAYECGFNSQATFQRTFKSLTSLTPKEFQQKHKKSL